MDYSEIIATSSMLLFTSILFSNNLKQMIRGIRILLYPLIIFIGSGILGLRRRGVVEEDFHIEMLRIVGYSINIYLSMQEKFMLAMFQLTLMQKIFNGDIVYFIFFAIMMRNVKPGLLIELGSLANFLMSLYSYLGTQEAKIRSQGMSFVEDIFCKENEVFHLISIAIPILTSIYLLCNISYQSPFDPIKRSKSIVFILATSMLIGLISGFGNIGMGGIGFIWIIGCNNSYEAIPLTTTLGIVLLMMKDYLAVDESTFYKTIPMTLVLYYSLRALFNILRERREASPPVNCLREAPLKVEQLLTEYFPSSKEKNSFVNPRILDQQPSSTILTEINRNVSPMRTRLRRKCGTTNY